jgi:hypothetical protein
VCFNLPQRSIETSARLASWGNFCHRPASHEAYMHSNALAKNLD